MTRLDQALVERGLCESREKAKRAIMAGLVKINEQLAQKPSDSVQPHDQLRLVAREKFVSRGGFKLEHALDHFHLNVTGQIAIDLGASTGGFTDCLLQRGAAKVFAIDVGHGQLAWKLRNDPRVVVMEKLNARFLSREQIPQLVDLCVIDVSFISLTLILPRAFELITQDGMILALIKPQFELEREDVGRGGIVREPALHEKAQQKIVKFVEEANYHVVGLVPSIVTGTDGNQEFFICIRKQSD